MRISNMMEIRLNICQHNRITHGTEKHPNQTIISLFLVSISYICSQKCLCFSFLFLAINCLFINFIYFAIIFVNFYYFLLSFFNFSTKLFCYFHIFFSNFAFLILSLVNFGSQKYFEKCFGFSDTDTCVFRFQSGHSGH